MCLLQLQRFELLTIDNIIQAVMALATVISIVLLFKTLKEGQRQSNANNNLTQQALSMSQHQIYFTEFKYFQEKFQDLKFLINNQLLDDEKFARSIEEVNGINYVSIFTNTSWNYMWNKDELNNTDRIDEFRHKVIFPLFRNYSILLNFLERIQDDKILICEHKWNLFLICERDLLQDYFRLTNNVNPNGSKMYNLSTFDSPGFQSENFYKVNKFYIQNDLFAIHPLEFYKKTL